MSFLLKTQFCSGPIIMNNQIGLGNYSPIIVHLASFCEQNCSKFTIYSFTGYHIKQIIEKKYWTAFFSQISLIFPIHPAYLYRKYSLIDIQMSASQTFISHCPVRIFSPKNANIYFYIKDSLKYVSPIFRTIVHGVLKCG